MKAITFKKPGLWSVPSCPWLPQIDRDTEKVYLVGKDLCPESARRALLNDDAEEVDLEESVGEPQADAQTDEPEPEPEPAKGKQGKNRKNKGS